MLKDLKSYLPNLVGVDTANGLLTADVVVNTAWLSYSDSDCVGIKSQRYA